MSKIGTVRPLLAALVTATAWCSAWAGSLPPVKTQGAVTYLSGGIGQPYVTTDYPAAQRAIETRCDAVLAAKDGIDGVYDSDPRENPGARRYVSLSSDEAIRRNLKAMDQSALLLARDHKLPVHVFNFDATGASARICQGEDVGTLVEPKAETQLV